MYAAQRAAEALTPRGLLAASALLELKNLMAREHFNGKASTIANAVEAAGQASPQLKLLSAEVLVVSTLNRFFRLAT